MAIMASDTGGGGEFKIVPSGNHVAICNMVIDLGNQRTEYMGETKTKHQIYIRWELPNERLNWTDKDGNDREGPMTTGKTYTLSLHENAALRADLENWRGRRFTEEELKGFDVAKLLGVPAMVSVTHAEKNGRTYANVSGVAGLPKGMPKPEPENALIIYDDEHLSAFENLPEWLRTKIQAQIIEQQKAAPQYHDLDDDVPF